jgi:hypothetical protein
MGNLVSYFTNIGWSETSVVLMKIWTEFSYAKFKFAIVAPTVFSSKISPYAISTIYTHPFKSSRVETENFYFFFNSRGITLSKNHRTINSNLTCAFLWCIYTCNFNLTHTSKQRLKIFPRGITLSTIIGPWPNSNLTCIILWYIHMSNLN